MTAMKRTDDYNAKLEFWVDAPRVVPLPYGVRIPGLTVERFDSYEAFNTWKRKQILKLAKLDPAQWQIPYEHAVPGDVV